MLPLRRPFPCTAFPAAGTATSRQWQPCHQDVEKEEMVLVVEEKV